MYDEVLPMTGVGLLVLGPIALPMGVVAALGVALLLAGILVMRLTRRDARRSS